MKTVSSLPLNFFQRAETVIPDYTLLIQMGYIPEFNFCA